MNIRTVLGDADSGSFTIISPHEHVLIDIRNQYTAPEDPFLKALGKRKVGLSNLDVLSRNPYAVKDNLVLNDSALAAAEIAYFKKAGGSAMVDATTCKAIGRNPEALAEVSKKTGVPIIAGCGYYTWDTHPSDMDGKTSSEIEEEILKDLQYGIGDTAVKAGVIGEIGTSREVHPNEWKTLEAGAAACAKTNFGIIVHTYPWTEKALTSRSILFQERFRPGKYPSITST